MIATTSSEEKATRLRSPGAHHVVNYRETAEWGDKVKALTADGKGVDIVVNVGGASTLHQSLKAVRIDGLIAATGVLGDSPDGSVPTILNCIFSPCTVRGLLLGSRKQFGDMNRSIETYNVKPILDERVFDMQSVKEAYTYLEQQKHFSKLGIRIQ